MHSVKPKGINIRQNDIDVPDEYLQECINLQHRDGVMRPIPNRYITDIDTTLYGRVILHKVGDEDQVNVLGFTRTLTGFLAEDLSAYLGGGEDTLNGDLTWFGTIVDGVYAEKTTPQSLSVTRTNGISWTIMNGLLYFMGDGSEAIERFFKRIQYNETDSIYEEKDMYAWKSLIPFYPVEEEMAIVCDDASHKISTRCGIISYRFALVLKSGEVVLPSPIYSSILHSLNRSESAILKDTVLDNIHTLIRLDLEFANTTLYGDEVSAINVYATTPKYYTHLPSNAIGDTMDVLRTTEIPDQISKQAEQPFYLVKTINESASQYLMMSVGQVDSDMEFYINDGLSSVEYNEVDISTIAAGEVMPIDNYSYHSLFGTITNYNGRLVVSKPTTVLSAGNMVSLALEDINCSSAFIMDTEDGVVSGIQSVSKSVTFTAQTVKTRGLMSYPDIRAGQIGPGDQSETGIVRYYNSRKNSAHNMSCAFGISYVEMGNTSMQVSGQLLVTLTYGVTYVYGSPDDVSGSYPTIAIRFYDSQNRVQFSTIGEFSVWPAINSYRVGDGKIMKVGANNVDQKSANVVGMLIVGATDGIWSINTDPTGNNFVSSVTRISRTPYLSSEVLQIGTWYVFVGDKGLMITENREEPKSLTYDYFPGYGDGSFPVTDNVLPNYLTLTDPYFGGDNPYILNDIVTYLKRAILAYDNKRNSIWCSNPYEDFSLIYDIDNQSWSMSTTVFAEAIEFFSSLETTTEPINNWYLVMDNNALQPYLLMLSGEDVETEVPIHMLTRPIKMGSDSTYKKIRRMYSRCKLIRDTGETGYFTFGLWGKQDVNKNKENIPITALYDGTTAAFPSDIRHDIPISRKKGKYKAVTILLGGLVLPDSSINRFDIDAELVDNNIMR